MIAQIKDTCLPARQGLHNFFPFAVISGNKFKLLLLLLFIALSGTAFAQARLEAKVSKDKVATGEIFTYTIKGEADSVSAKLILPDFENFVIVSQNQAQNYSLKNTKTVIEFVLVYGLLAPRPGSFLIKEAVLKDKGSEGRTKPINIEVSGKPLEDKRKIQPYLERGTDI